MPSRPGTSLAESTNDTAGILASPPVVVGLDLSLTSCGVTRAGESTTLVTKSAGAERLRRLRDAVLGYTADADLVVIEDYAFGARFSHAHGLGELGGVVRLALYEAGVTFVTVNPSVLKRYATGSGAAKKDQMLAEAIRRLNYQGNSHDEADSLWLYAMGMDHLGAPIATVPTQQRESLLKVAWPAIKAPA